MASWLALFTACSSSSSGSSPKAEATCDPLAAPPTSLENVLGVGSDGKGTLYVADKPAGASEPRAFVSTGGGSLVRQDVIGSGESGSAEPSVTEYSLSFAPPDGDEANAQTLLFDVGSGGATGMALGGSDGKQFLGGPGQTPLTVVDPSTVTGLSIINLPNVVAYVADVSDGTSIVVTSPMDINSSADFHLFYGPADAMVERTIVTFNQALSGYPDISFQVGAAQYAMSIGGSFGADGGTGPGPGTLDTGSASVTFTIRQPTPATLSGFSFTCL